WSRARAAVDRAQACCSVLAARTRSDPAPRSRFRPCLARPLRVRSRPGPGSAARWAGRPGPANLFAVSAIVQLDALLGELTARPDDDALRERAARGLSERGRHEEAVEILAPLINLTAHDGPTLPCLCRRCLAPERVEAEAEGLRFARRFVVARARVLYYWARIELADDPGLARAVRDRLARRLAPRA